jgi:hypothetical protein
LGGDNFANEKNDATNAYYIYNRGNITYSGAGHNPSGLSDDEAKLFVNTMIAAYRAGSGAAGVSFRTAADDEASVLLFPVQTQIEEIEDENGVERSVEVTRSLSGEQTTYFKIVNSNLKTDNTTLAVDLYYEVPSNTTGAVTATSLGIKVSNDTAVNDALFLKNVSMGSIYRADDETTPATRTNLSSDVLYKTTVPADVLKYVASLADQTDPTLNKDGKLYIVATTTIKVDETTTNTYKSFDVLTLKRLGLLRLE